jgi:uncharacterized membrane protein
MADIKQQDKQEKERARKELYESIKPDSSSKLYAAVTYILLPAIALVLGLMELNSGIVVPAVWLVGLIIYEYVKDPFVRINSILAAMYYLFIQVGGLVLALVLIFILSSNPDIVGIGYLILGLWGLAYLGISVVLAIAALFGTKIYVPILTNRALDRIIKDRESTAVVAGKKA